MSDSFNHWMRLIADTSMLHCYSGMYEGEDGAKRFAREVGAALPDFSKDEKNLHDMVSKTYSGICVIAYRLAPPIDAHTWIKEMWVGTNKALDVVPVPKPNDYRPTAFRLDASPDSYKAIWRGKAMPKEDT